MTEKKKRLLQIPQGTESFYFEEAFRHQQAVTRLNELFTLWGYLPVETPLFDFFEIYQDMVSGKEKDIYRLIDREGDLLMLRSDITLFLAKQIGLLSHSTDLPLRVYYSGAILRHQNFEDISKNEFFQTGVELIGKSGFNADMEILTLLSKTFSALNVHPSIHIGSRELLNTLFSDFSEEERIKALEMAGNRDFTVLDEFLHNRISEEKLTFIMELLPFIGSDEELRNLMETSAYTLTVKEEKNIVYLLSLLEMIKKMNMSAQFRIDISETGSQSYYTGIVFQGYLEGIDSAVVSGGRYDALLRQFGLDTPSVGFSILLRKIENSMGSDFSIPKEHVIIEKQDFMTAYAQAENLRNRGRIAIL